MKKITIVQIRKQNFEMIYKEERAMLIMCICCVITNTLVLMTIKASLFGTIVADFFIGTTIGCMAARGIISFRLMRKAKRMLSDEHLKQQTHE